MMTNDRLLYAGPNVLAWWPMQHSLGMSKDTGNPVPN